MAQKPAAAEPEMPGSRNKASVVTAPHNTPLIPGATARDPPVQAATPNSSTAASVNANNTGRADKAATASPESGNTRAASMPAAAKTNPNRSLLGFMAVPPFAN